MKLPIEAEGSLMIAAPTGEAVRVFARRDTITIELTDWRTLSSLGPRTLRGRRSAIARVARALAILGLSARVGLSGRAQVAIGAGQTPSVIARLLRLGPVKVPLTTLPQILRGL